VTITESPRAINVAALVDAIDPAAEIRYRQALAREAAIAQQERSWSEGYAAAVADIKRAEHELLRAVRLGLARTAPAGAAWLAAVTRNGGTQYAGAGRPRVAVPAVDITRVQREQGGVNR
jgi:hypothetical protein